MVNEAEIKDWYNKKHRSLGNETWRPFEAYPVILNYLKVEASKKLLDVGCGTGYLLKAADQRGLQTYGIDISEEGVKIAKQNAPNSHLTIGHGENLEYQDGTFDYVVCLGALEHFLDMKKGLQEMRRVGKANAQFCVMVPNVDYFFWKVKGSKGTEQQKINENLLSLQEWKKLFTDEGFEILDIHKDQWRLKEEELFSPFNPAEIILKMLYKIALLSLPLKYTYQFIFILEKSGKKV